MFNSLRGKITSVMVLITLTITVSLTVISYFKVKESVIVQMKSDGTTLITVLSKDIEKSKLNDLNEIQLQLKGVKEKSEENIEYISIADENLDIILDNTKVYDNNIQKVDGVSGATEQGDIKQTVSDGQVDGFIFEKEGKKVYNVSSPVTFKDGNKAIFNIGISLDSMYAYLKAALIDIVLISLGIQVIVIIIAMIISNLLTKPLTQITDLLEEVENNNLKVQMNIESNSEIGKLSKGLNNTVNNLRNTIGSIRNTAIVLGDSADILVESASETSLSSKDISMSTGEVSSVIEKQGQSISNIVDIFEDFSIKLDEMINEINIISDGNNNINKVTVDSINELHCLVNSIEDVREFFSSFIKNITMLSDRIQKIDEITVLINNIAEQTNLLSLNAAIEAARVGEVGNGFGVVADSIRTLSEQVKDSSKSINNIVKDISDNTKEIINISNVLDEKIDSQKNIVHRTVNSCDGIINEINNNNSKLTTEVYQSLRVLSEEKQVITNSVNNISNIALEITASTEEIMATMENQSEETEKLSLLGEKLNDVSKDLIKMVEMFEL